VRAFFHTHFCKVLASRGVRAGEQAAYTPPSHIYLTPGRPERHKVNPHRKIPWFLPPARLEPWILVVGGDGANHYTNMAPYYRGSKHVYLFYKCRFNMHRHNYYLLQKSHKSLNKNGCHAHDFFLINDFVIFPSKRSKCAFIRHLITGCYIENNVTNKGLLIITWREQKTLSSHPWDCFIILKVLLYLVRIYSYTFVIYHLYLQYKYWIYLNMM